MVLADAKLGEGLEFGLKVGGREVGLPDFAKFGVFVLQKFREMFGLG